MDDRQENTLSMYQVVGQTLDANATVWSGVVAIVTARTAFGTEVTTIQSLAQSQQQSSAGVTADKQQLRGAMADAAMPVVGALKALAAVTGNDDLAAQVAFSRSNFIYGRDNQAATNGDIVHTQGTANATALANYGITAAMLTTLRDAIDAFRDAISRPREVISATAAFTAQLDAAFARASAVLTGQLDNLIELFRVSNPTFYQQYQNARELVDTGATPTPPPPNP